MAELINHNSTILFGLIILTVGAAIMIRRGLEPKRIITLGVLVVLVGAGFLAIRPEAGTDSSAAEINAQIGAGTPVLLEFQSRN